MNPFALDHPQGIKLSLCGQNQVQESHQTNTYVLQYSPLTRDKYERCIA